MGCLRGVLLACCMVAALTCAAQKGKGLPDSVNTSGEEVTAPAADTLTTVTVDSAAITNAAANFAADSLARAADTVVFRSTPDSVTDRYKRDKDYAYANDPAYWKIVPPDADRDNRIIIWLFRLFSSAAFRYCLYIFLAGALLFVLYWITKENKLHLFYRSGPKKHRDPGTEEGAALLDEDLDKKIAEALQARDHRLGTRYLFLKTLRLLDERELIRYQVEATNHEYILQMSSHRQGAAFQFLAGAYEYVWYGDFALSEQQFDRLINYFQDFYKNIAAAVK